MLTRTTIRALAVTATLALTAAIPTSLASATVSEDLDTAKDHLENTIDLKGCSAAYMRFPSSKDTDKAMMLTNGHCYNGGMPKPGEAIVNKVAKLSGTLLGKNGKALGQVHTELAMYVSMTHTDISLYRLTETYAEINKKYQGAKPLLLRGTRPADKSDIIIPSSAWKETWHCHINGFVYKLKEADYIMQDSIRYDFPPECNTKAGTSGSPILDAKAGDIVGVNNTGNDNGKKCVMDNPCEIDKNGKITYKKGQAYGQQTYWLVGCIDAKNQIDLKKKGCRLQGGDTNPQP